MTHASKFALFSSPEVRVEPSIKPYKAANDLRNVINREMFDLSPAQRATLVENGFVVVPRFHKQLFSVYVENKDKRHPSFVTSDLLLHTFHVIYDDTLRRLEEKVFLLNLETLTDAMLQAALEQYKSADSREVRRAAERNVCFFAVAEGILSSKKVSLPKPLAQKVKAELKLIQNHTEVRPSPTFGYAEDYTQYVPRGHYDESPELRKYFQCMMWYSRMMFQVPPGESAEERGQGKQETLSALLVTTALKNTKIGDRDALTLWDEIYSPISFFVGVSDDLNVYDYLEISKEVFGELRSVEQLSDSVRIDQFLSLAQELRGPSISSAVLPVSQISRLATITKGFRFMGSRFIPDSYIFMELVHPKVMERSFPTGLDVMAVLGSKRAEETLNDVYQEFRYEGYAAQLEQLKKEFAEYPVTTWTQNLYWAWLHCLKALLGEVGEGYPPFMQNKTWQDKELNTALGSWAELRHDVLLHAKQSEVSKEEMGESRVDLGYVEPVPEFYARLASLVRMTWEGLEKRGLFDKLMPGPEPERRGDTDEDWDTYMDEWQKWEEETKHARKEEYQELEGMLLKSKEVSEKELENRSLSKEEYDFIQDIGYDLARLNFYPRDEPLFDVKDMSVVADVHTESFAHRECLEVAVGRAMELYAVVNVEDRLRLARGSVFSYYEFLRPMEQRMTDAEWRELQEKGPLPPRPVWTRSFIRGGSDGD